VLSPAGSRGTAVNHENRGLGGLEGLDDLGDSPGLGFGGAGPKDLDEWGVEIFIRDLGVGNILGDANVSRLGVVQHSIEDAVNLGGGSGRVPEDGRGA